MRSHGVAQPSFDKPCLQNTDQCTKVLAEERIPETQEEMLGMRQLLT